MEEKADITLKGVQQADRISQKVHEGHGNALAQAYNHLILPQKRPEVRPSHQAFGPRNRHSLEVIDWEEG